MTVEPAGKRFPTSYGNDACRGKGGDGPDSVQLPDSLRQLTGARARRPAGGGAELALTIRSVGTWTFPGLAFASPD